ncbi:quinone-dependent dihydroorotate dehydrogenase [Brevundimonas aveniformis]|uniref:quinone-dependent dihydroorotate dehydrogenase n=1 Tax=Brevundimonas aveniformis TaxID=370977 RepID=UPI002490D6B8|nr:quinone-dependent dihydroorotate dehydrogenase [Brevundimonas aveniformis]
MTLQDTATGLLRALDPETAHGLALQGLAMGLGPKDRTPNDPALEIEVAGLKLPNPVGLAAGFDKDARVPDALLDWGFGMIELGGVTPRPQPGNPRPRLFRLSEDGAVINRMGFNNQGLDAFAHNLLRRRRPGIVGVNLGANKDSQDRTEDYVTGLKRLWGLADYFAVNVSSPNTPGLRNLQSEAALTDLLGRLSEARQALPQPRAPVFLKVAPDLIEDEVLPIVEACLTFGMDGLIVSNTTLARPSRLTSPLAGETGGLSGAPLMAASTQVLGWFHQAAAGRLPLIGVGGIRSGADAYAKIRAGASAVQLYSALVFEGPSLIGRIRTDLAERLKADGFTHVREAIGAA